MPIKNAKSCSLSAKSNSANKERISHIGKAAHGKSGSRQSRNPDASGISGNTALLSHNLREFVALLNANEVKHLIVGGIAVGFHGYPPNRLDLITTLTGVDFGTSYAQRVVTQDGGMTFNFIDLENLKLNKRASGRPQDLADIANLE